METFSWRHFLAVVKLEATKAAKKHNSEAIKGPAIQGDNYSCTLSDVGPFKNRQIILYCIVESPRKHSCSWRIDMEYGRLIWYRNFLCCRRFAEFCASEKIPPAWLTVLQYSLYFFWCCRHWKTPQFYHLVRGLCPLAANFPNQESQRRWESRKKYSMFSHLSLFNMYFFNIHFQHFMAKKRVRCISLSLLRSGVKIRHLLQLVCLVCDEKLNVCSRLTDFWREIKRAREVWRRSGATSQTAHSDPGQKCNAKAILGEEHCEILWTSKGTINIIQNEQQELGDIQSSLDPRVQPGLYVYLSIKPIIYLLLVAGRIIVQ